MSNRVEISTRLERKDYRRVLYFNVFTRRKWFLPLYILLIVYALFLIAVMSLGLIELPVSYAYPAILFLVFALMLIVVIELQLKNLLRFDKNLGINVKKMTFDENGIKVVNSKINKGIEKKENQYLWDKLHYIFESKGYFLFFTGKRTVVIVPKRDVKEEDLPNIREYIKAFKVMRKKMGAVREIKAPKLGQ